MFMRSIVLQIFELNLRLILLYNSSCYVHWDLIEQSTHYQKKEPVIINIFVKEKLQGSQYENDYSKDNDDFVTI